jgi:hypothetical protein
MLAWVYILAGRRRAAAEQEKEPEETGMPAETEDNHSGYYSAEVIKCQKELSSAVEVLSESLEVCRILSDQLYRGGLAREAAPGGWERVEAAGSESWSPGDGSRLNISRELRQLYRHVEKNRRREFVS